jgi:hypothetical protein
MTNATRTNGAGQAAIETDEFERLLDRPHEVAQVGVFSDPKHFEHAQRVAKMLISSKLAPEMFQGEQNLGSAVIAVDMAFRLRMNPLMVMQQIYIVYGKPGWSSQFIIACLNSCGRYSPLRFEIQELGEKAVEYEYTVYNGQQKSRAKGTSKIQDVRCRSWVIEKETGERLEGPWVSVEMAVKEGWYNRNDSKWKTMQELMLRYRAATLFGRLYAPELLMGMQAVEEIVDVGAEITNAIAPSKPTFTVEKPQPKPEAPAEPAAKASEPSPVPTVATPEESDMRKTLSGMLESVPFDGLRMWLINTDRCPDADSLGSIDEIPLEVVRQLLAEPAALKRCITLHGGKAVAK